MANEYQTVVETSIKFQGRKYTRKSNGYYYNCGTRKHLHQAIWIAHNGPIPDGCEIHHKDFNKENNDISNLECLTKKEHHELHNALLTDEEKQWKRENLDKNARPAAIAWHKSEAGRKWHSEHAKKMAENGTNGFTKRVKLICTNCGKEYEGVPKSSQPNHFCSNACKARYLRRKRKEDRSDTRKCVICGKTFNCSKWSGAETCSPECACKLRANNKKQENGIPLKTKPLF